MTSPVQSSSALQASLDVRVVLGRLRRQLMSVADGDDLTPGQASVLMRVARDEVATASALAALEQVRPQSMTVTLAALEQAGLIQRTTDPHDGRRHLVEITDAGRARVEGARDARHEWLTTRMQSEFTETERQRIIAAMRLLERLAG
jgi:DNA-binding MarR family transcriptional regulator